MKIRQLTTDPAWNGVHAYHTGTAYHPDGRRVLYAKFRTLRGKARICVMDRETGQERVLGQSARYNYHSGACQFWCDGGRKAIYQQARGKVALCDLATGAIHSFPGQICGYSGTIQDRFVEVDADYRLKDQGRMGVYLRKIDGSDKRRIATVDDLLAANPAGQSIRRAKVLLRLGAQASPDQKRVAIYLVTRDGALIRDDYTCAMDGSGLCFHGKLGCHAAWAANSRDLYSAVSSGMSLVGEFKDRVGANPYEHTYRLLAVYNTKTRKQRVMSSHKIRGGSHPSASPDGALVTLDQITERDLAVLLFDRRTKRMRALYARPPARRQGRVYRKALNVNPHPVFSHDSRKVLFNAWAGDRVQVFEADLDA